MSGARGRQFAVGQVVVLLPGPDEPAAEGNRYEVTRLLPRDADAWQYQVRGASGGLERRVREAQLRMLRTQRRAFAPSTINGKGRRSATSRETRLAHASVRRPRAPHPRSKPGESHPRLLRPP